MTDAPLWFAAPTIGLFPLDHSADGHSNGANYLVSARHTSNYETKDATHAFEIVLFGLGQDRDSSESK